MATDQNIKNKTLSLEIDTAYGKYGALHGRYIYFYFPKCTRKPSLGNLFAVDRIFHEQLKPEDIQYCIVIHET